METKSGTSSTKPMKKAPWVHTYAPKHTTDVVGHENEIVQIKRYLENYKPGQKPLLLVGRSGVGKTSIVYALAHELDLELGLREPRFRVEEHRQRDLRLFQERGDEP